MKRIDFGEADQIVTVLTRDFGKISVLAKGARRLKSKFCGRLEPASQVKLDYFQGRTLGHVNEVEVTSSPQLDELKELSILFYILEATHKLIPEGQECAQVFDLLSESLRENIDELILYAYLVKLLTLLGFMGSFEQCARSNRKLDLAQPVYLSSRDASLVHGGYEEPSDMRVTAAVVKWVNYMQEADFASLKKVTPSRGEKTEAFYVLKSVLGGIFTKPFKSEAAFIRFT